MVKFKIAKQTMGSVLDRVKFQWKLIINHKDHQFNFKCMSLMFWK